jgi:hypothetical protein
MKNNTNNVQVHDEYALIMLKENVKEISGLPKQTEQPLLAPQN